MSKNAKITATLNLDTKEWTRELTKGKDQLRAFQTGISSIKLKKIPMPEFEAPTAGGFGRFEHMRGQWEQFSKKGLADMNKNSRSSAMGMMELSRAFEDAQYGMAGVINQVPGIVSGFGGSMGLASAVSFAAVSIFMLTKSYKYMMEVMGKDDETNKAAKQKRLAAAIAETSRRIDEQKAAYEKRMNLLDKTESGGMDYMDRELEQTNALEKAKADLAGTDKARFAAEEAALTRQIEMLKEKNAVMGQRVRDSAAEIQRMEAEYKSLSRLSYSERGVDGSMQTRTKYGNPTDKARGAVLERQLELQRARLEQLQGEMSGYQIKSQDATFQRDKILPVNRQAAEQAAEKARAAEQQKQHEEQMKRFEEFGDAMRQAAEETRKEIQAMRDRAAKQAAANQATREDAEIANARARGHNSKANRLERDVTRRRRQQSLEAEGFSPQEAANIAQQEQRNQRGTSGQRIGGPEARPSGLDAFDFNQRGFRPQTPNLDEARRQPAPRFPAGNDNNKGGTIGDMITALKTGLATVTAKLEELKNSNAAPVADTVRPVNG